MCRQTDFAVSLSFLISLVVFLVFVYLLKHPKGLRGVLGGAFGVMVGPERSQRGSGGPREVPGGRGEVLEMSWRVP